MKISILRKLYSFVFILVLLLTSFMPFLSCKSFTATRQVDYFLKAKSCDKDRLFNVDVYVEGKSYLKPKAYQSLEEVEKDKYFTLNDGDIVVKGIIDFELSEEKGSNIKYLNENYDDVGIINTVVTYDCGSDYMKHWKVVCS